MEICNGDYGSYTSKLVESIENGKSDVWRSTKTFCSDKNKETIISQQVAKRLYSFETEFRHTPHYTANFWRQLRILIKRNAIKLFRDKVMYIKNLIRFFEKKIFIKSWTFIWYKRVIFMIL